MSEYAKGFDVGLEAGKSFERERIIMLLQNTMCPEYGQTEICSCKHKSCVQTEGLIDLMEVSGGW